MLSKCYIALTSILLATVSFTGTVYAESCMVSPTAKSTVSGRFGKVREGGSGNFGSTNQAAHMHDGLDFSTSGASLPVYATTDGTISSIGLRGSAGNAILLKRDSGDVVAYYHLSGFATGLKVGTHVSAGQQLGISGNTPSGAMAKHLHFVYGTAQKDTARAIAFPQSASKGTFNPGQLPFAFNQQSGIGWKTDPSPYFCNTFPINDGNPQHYALLGADTKSQYSILFGSIPANGVAANGGLDPVQVSAANSDAVVAQSAAQSPSDFLSDSDGFGALPSAPVGGYDTMSSSEMMFTEATRRMTDTEWNNNITKVSSRALWVDYARAAGVSAYLDDAIYRKKERVEALLAVYVSQKLDGLKQEVTIAQITAQKDFVKATIK